jgi:hypothetical protein
MATSKTRGLKKVCSRVIKGEGLKVDGTLKKGYKYVNGKPKKVTAKKKATPKKRTAKKKAVKRKAATRKKAATRRKTTRRKTTKRK